MMRKMMMMITDDITAPIMMTITMTVTMTTKMTIKKVIMMTTRNMMFRLYTIDAGHEAETYRVLDTETFILDLG